MRILRIWVLKLFLETKKTFDLIVLAIQAEIP